MRISASKSRLVSAVFEALQMLKPTLNAHHLTDDKEFIFDDLPPIGMKVEVIGYVGSTRHIIPFVCCWTEEGWVIAGTRRKIAFDVSGWRRAGV